MNKREFLKLNALVVGGIMLNPVPSWSMLAKNENNEFTLPPLSYDFNALEPAIDTLTMQIHHGKHHAGYVSNLNKAIKGSEFENKSIEEILSKVSPSQTATRNNAGGHYNHTLFWKTLAPNTNPANPSLSKSFEKALRKTFGAQPLAPLMEAMTEAGKKLFGSGWVWLVVDDAKNLKVMTTPNQDNPLMKGIVEETGTPIFGIDVWEHAYYLKYQNKRADYLTEIWKVVNWQEVSTQYEMATQRKKK